MNVRLADIAEWVGGRLCEVSGDVRVDLVATDSRRMVDGTLFVALRGPHFDGHSFADEALERGAAAVMVERGSGVIGPRIEVDDTLGALQAFAAAWRQQFEGIVVGITGSYGKTIVKEMLMAILGLSGNVFRSPGSYNSQVGVALALLGIRPEHDIAIIEAGVSLRGEMKRLEAMIRPDVGILTTIGDAHRAGLGGSAEAITSEKMQLFARTPGVVLLPADVQLDELRPDEPKMFHVKQCEGYWARNIAAQSNGFGFELVGPDGASTAIELPTPGRYNVANAVAAAGLATELGADPTDIAGGLAEFHAAPMRLEMHTTQSGITLLNDAYISDPTSARTALEELQFYAGLGHRTVAILGDMRELGELAPTAHLSLGRFVADKGIDLLFAVGEHAQAVVDGAVERGLSPDAVRAYATLDEINHTLEESLEPGDFVLFKGSRAVGLERLAAGLVDAVAAERLEIDLETICSNVRALRRTIGAVEVMAVVKSFAYGNDSTRISQTLVREGVSRLAVAYPDEAIPLRRRGIDVPILVTNVLAAEADKIGKYRLTALVSSSSVVEALSTSATARGEEIPVHLEIDTGMARMGVVGVEAALRLAETIRRAPGVRLEGAMTHFAAADDASEDTFTREQMRRFDATVAELKESGHDIQLVHAANTAAAWRFPKSRYDLVRIGLGLYGIAPSPDVARAATLEPALRFTSRVLQVREIEQGESVGYGRAWRAERPSKVATVAIGYNDGFPRFMSNGGDVLIQGQRCPVVGSVCMDATMVDVTDLDEVLEGEEVVLFGAQGAEQIDVEEVARRGSTISYEILTGISPRVRRIFRRGAS